MEQWCISRNRNFFKRCVLTPICTLCANPSRIKRFWGEIFLCNAGQSYQWQLQFSFNGVSFTVMATANHDHHPLLLLRLRLVSSKVLLLPPHSFSPIVHCCDSNIPRSLYVRPDGSLTNYLKTGNSFSRKCWVESWIENGRCWKFPYSSCFPPVRLPAHLSRV